MIEPKGASSVVERLLESDRARAFVLICEAVDRYLPIIDSVGVLMLNGQVVKVADLDPRALREVEETRKSLRRADRIVWALRYYKKALIKELLWMVENESKFFVRITGQAPATEQPGLQRQLQKVADVDLSDYEEETWDNSEPPCTGFEVIRDINARLRRYLELADLYGAREPDNLIHRLVFQQQPVGEIDALFHRGELDLLRKYTANWEAREVPGTDLLQDSEGEIETMIEFPNGWRWFNLRRTCSEVHGEQTMGHCGNVPSAQAGQTIYELAEPMGRAADKDMVKWKPHATFIFDTSTGLMGEMKGRKNQKPSPRLWKYVFELLRARKEILGIAGAGYRPDMNFVLKDLSPTQLAVLKKERPELWQHSSPDQLPEEDVPHVHGHIMPGQPA